MKKLAWNENIAIYKDGDMVTKINVFDALLYTEYYFLHSAAEPGFLTDEVGVDNVFASIAYFLERPFLPGCHAARVDVFNALADRLPKVDDEEF